MPAPALPAQNMLVLLNEDITAGYSDGFAPSAEPLRGTTFTVYAAILSYDHGDPGGEIHACTDEGMWCSVREIRLRNGDLFSRNADGSWTMKDGPAQGTLDVSGTLSLSI